MAGLQRMTRLEYILRLTVDGCYSYKFLRSSARRFLLEMLVRSKRYEVARAGLRTSPLTMVKFCGHDENIKSS